jgi:predicted RNA methylase
MRLFDLLQENYDQLYKSNRTFNYSKKTMHDGITSQVSTNITQKLFENVNRTFFRFLLNPYEYLTLNTVYKYIGKQQVHEWRKLVQSPDTIEHKYFSLKDDKLYVNNHLFIPVSGHLTSIGDKRYQYNEMFNELNLVSDKKQICLSIQVYGPLEIDEKKNLNLLTDIFEMVELHKKSDYKNVNLYVGKPISRDQKLDYNNIKYNKNIKYNNNIKYNVNRFLNSSFKFHENQLESIQDIYQLEQFIGKYKKKITLLESRFLSETPKFYPNTEQNYVKTLYLLTYIVFNNLEKDGTFILDTSTFYEEETHQILFILSEHFRNTVFYFGKLEGIYTPKIVFKHYKGCDQTTIDDLMKSIQSHDRFQNINNPNFQKFVHFIHKINFFIEERYRKDTLYIQQLTQFLNDSKQIDNILKFNIDKTIRYCVEHKIDINQIYNDVSLRNLFQKTENREYIVRHLFPNENQIDFRKLKITVESIYSVTPPDESDKIIQLMKKYIQHDLDHLVITDAISNAGGNTLSFSKHFKSVNAVEIDKQTFEYLKHNMQLYNRTNITYYNQDYTLVMDKLNQDVVFIDPPWGGILYKYHQNIDLYMSQISLHLIVKQLFHKGNIVCCKVPYNYNFEPIFQDSYYSEIIIKPIRNYKIFIVK